MTPTDEDYRRYVMDEMGVSEREAFEAAVLESPEAAKKLTEAARFEAMMYELGADLAANPLAEPAPDTPERAGLWRRMNEWLFSPQVWMPLTAAAAAGGLVWISLPTDGPELPDYELAIDGGQKTARGAEDPTEIPYFPADSAVQIALRPASDAGSDVQAIVATGADYRPLEGDTEVHPSGAIRMKIPATSLDSGVQTLCVAVGPPGPAPSAAALCGGDVVPDGWWRGGDIVRAD